MIDAEQGRYFIVDAQTRQLLREVKVEEGQELLMIPIATPG